ncbi:MAG TPA: hypothetical protein DDX72_00095, partial [Ruminococcaceae bacterium]|nr:hypothetical protein [Oscillospiraceae bacterium]
MIIDRKTVEYTASLSRLRVPEGEVASICDELSTMLDYVDEINATINTELVVPQVADRANVTRP